MRLIDRKNTIENLEQNIRWIEEIECHQFPGWGNVTMAMRDAAELLKEQEPIRPWQVSSMDPWFKCGACHKPIEYEHMFCPYCGRAVKWK